MHQNLQLGLHARATLRKLISNKPTSVQCTKIALARPCQSTHGKFLLITIMIRIICLLSGSVPKLWHVDNRQKGVWQCVFWVLWFLSSACLGCLLIMLQIHGKLIDPELLTQINTQTIIMNDAWRIRWCRERTLCKPLPYGMRAFAKIILKKVREFFACQIFKT